MSRLKCMDMARLITVSHVLNPDQVRRFEETELYPNCVDTLVVFLKYFFFEKGKQTTKSCKIIQHALFIRCDVIKLVQCIYYTYSVCLSLPGPGFNLPSVELVLGASLL